MSGWAIPQDKCDMIIARLIEIRDEFQKAKDDFLKDYDESLAGWIVKHKEWGAIIRNSVVSSDYVRNRMSFRWQLYKVAPLVESANATAVNESDLAEEVANLGNTLYSEIASSASEIRKKVYAGKTEVTHKALSPLKTLHEKLLGLTFVEPHVAPVADIIQTALKRVAPKGNIVGADLLMLQGLVCLLKDSESLISHSRKLIEGYGPATVLDSLVQDAKGEKADSPQPKRGKSPSLPELPPLQPKVNVPSMGLW